MNKVILFVGDKHTEYLFECFEDANAFAEAATRCTNKTGIQVEDPARNFVNALFISTNLSNKQSR
jgi:hypothetical protein